MGSYNIIKGVFVCDFCGREFPMYYVNKGKFGKSYWGNGQRYNYRGALGNFQKHERSCKKLNSNLSNEKPVG